MTETSEALVSKLLKWFEVNKRWMPWRETKNPYYIWISEIMLQQTRVETVIDYYQRFINRFPLVEDLATATEEEVLKSWEGLGYYSRGRNMHRAARVIIDKHGGKVPNNYKEIIKLPGVGPYTAGAILSIAYNQPAPAIDGNVLRVYSRLYNIKKDIMEKETVDEVRELVHGMMPLNFCDDFSEALMELGATICLPKNPRCEECPLKVNCIAKELNMQDQLPIRINKTKVSQHNKAICWIENNNKILVKKNKEKGLLAGMWILPTLDIKEKSQDPIKIQKEIDNEFNGILIEHYVGEGKHIFTHQKWHISIFKGSCNPQCQHVNPEFQWIDKEELQNIALPTLYQKVIKTCETTIIIT